MNLAPMIGTPVYRSSPYGDKTGWIAAVEPIGGNVYSLAGGAMIRQTHNLTVVFEDDTESTVPNTVAAPWLDAAQSMTRIEALDPDSVAAKLRVARNKVAEEKAKAKRAAETEAAAYLAFQDKYRDKIPADAVALIVAELQRDDCDTMSDYFNVKTDRLVIIGFSTHTRDLFSEMRKAARNFPETAHLADAPASAEHREKWSMGSGYYLKAGNKYDSAWAVRKRTLYLKPGQDRAAALPFAEWAVPDTTAPKPQLAKVDAPTTASAGPEAAAATVNGFTISHHTHTKKGFQMAIVETPERVTPDQFTARLNRARDAGGWYSRAWGGTPAGFAFKDAAKAIKFAESIHA